MKTLLAKAWLTRTSQMQKQIQNNANASKAHGEEVTLRLLAFVYAFALSLVHTCETQM